MLTITPLTTDHLHFLFCEALYCSSFPIEERRDLDFQRNLCDHNPVFKYCVIETQKTPIGLITYWVLDGFYFIEHFAITPSEQQKGYGSRVLNQLISDLTTDVAPKIVLEVEHPIDLITQKRILFYQKAGFSICSTTYKQPPYRATNSYLKLTLMSYGLDYYEIDLIKITAEIYEKVYGVMGGKAI